MEATKFTYEISDILKKVCNTSLYLADNAKDYQGNDDLNMGLSDRDFFIGYFKEACADVWAILNSLNKHHICDAFTIDDTEVIFTIDITNRNKDILPMWSEAIQSYITYYVLKQWFELKGYAPYVALCQSKAHDYRNTVRNMKNRFNKDVVIRKINPLL